MSNAQRCLDGYVEAWRTNEPDDIRRLFAADAVYRGAAHDPEPSVGVDDIVAFWGEEADAPDAWTFEGSVDFETSGAAVIRGVTTYTSAPKVGVYDNLWIVRFDGEGRATEFQDWWGERKS